MSMRYLYLGICGVVFAGIVHISIILLIPDYGSRDAWNIISAKSDLWAFRVFSKGTRIDNTLEDTDPYLKLGACTFDLDESGLRISGGQSKIFWSLSVFDQDGKVIYSLNNRTSINHKLDLLLLNPVQMISLREALPEDIENSVVVEAEVSKGFVILRQFQNNSISTAAVDQFMGQARCEKFAS